MKELLSRGKRGQVQSIVVATVVIGQGQQHVDLAIPIQITDPSHEGCCIPAVVAFQGSGKEELLRIPVSDVVTETFGLGEFHPRNRQREASPRHPPATKLLKLCVGKGAVGSFPGLEPSHDLSWLQRGPMKQRKGTIVDIQNVGGFVLVEHVPCRGRRHVDGRIPDLAVGSIAVQPKPGALTGEGSFGVASRNLDDREGFDRLCANGSSPKGNERDPQGFTSHTQVSVERKVLGFHRLVVLLALELPKLETVDPETLEGGRGVGGQADLEPVEARDFGFDGESPAFRAQQKDAVLPEVHLPTAVAGKSQLEPEVYPAPIGQWDARVGGLGDVWSRSEGATGAFGFEHRRLTGGKRQASSGKARHLGGLEVDQEGVLGIARGVQEQLAAQEDVVPGQELDPLLDEGCLGDDRSCRGSLEPDGLLPVEDALGIQGDAILSGGEALRRPHGGLFPIGLHELDVGPSGAIGREQLVEVRDVLKRGLEPPRLVCRWDGFRRTRTGAEGGADRQGSQEGVGEGVGERGVPRRGV